MHILGYGFPVPNDNLAEFTKVRTVVRRERNKKIFDMLIAAGVRLDFDQYLNPENGLPKMCGRPQIAQILIDGGYASDFNQAFRKYLGEGAPCYCPLEEFSVDEAVGMIRGAGGLAFLAHPHLIKSTKLLKDLLK